jgi:hypothetical protein
LSRREFETSDVVFDPQVGLIDHAFWFFGLWPPGGRRRLPRGV